MSKGSVVLIDGECVVCDGFAQFVAQRDAEGAFYFETQQSNAGQQLLKVYDQPLDLTTIILIEKDGKEERCHTKSTAVLRILRRLSFPWSCCAVFEFVPTRLRDWCYMMFAKNRLSLFGKKETCSLPDKLIRQRLMRRLDE